MKFFKNSKKYKVSGVQSEFSVNKQPNTDSSETQKEHNFKVSLVILCLNFVLILTALRFNRKVAMVG